MSEALSLPLVDGPIAEIIGRIQDENPQISNLVDSPRRLLAFKAFASIRVGVVLGELLVESEIDADDRSERWVDDLLRNPEHKARVVAEVAAAAEEISRDARYRDDAPLGPDEAVRRRVQEFVRRQRDAN